MPHPLGLVAAGILLAGVAVFVWLRRRVQLLGARERAYVAAKGMQAGWIEPTVADECEAWLREVS
jgi:hypothetical protein